LGEAALADTYDEEALKTLGDILVETQLLSHEQWETVLTKAAGRDPFASVLDLLSRSHAHWSPPDNPSKALTEYQRRRIEKCRASGNFRALRQALRWERRSKKSGLSNFLVLEPLGKGGMGVVYKCWDVDRQMYVAIKRSKYENAKPGRRTAQIVRRRLRREAKIQGLLEHPNIARYIDFIEGAKSDLLVLEFVNGKTLFDLVRSRDVIPWKIVAGWAIALLDALDHAHGRSVIHRDIKPKNIILQKTPAGYVAKLLDMGLAKSISTAADLGDTLGAEVTSSGLIIGSAAFMAPEQWASATDASRGSDIYSLGVTLYFAFCGQVPFEAEDAAGYCFAHTQTPPPSIRLLRPEIPVGLDLLLQRMMAKDPAKRGTAGELRAVFAKLLAPESPDAAKASTPQMPKRRPKLPKLPATTSPPPETAVLPPPTVTIQRPTAPSAPGPSPVTPRVSTSTVLRLARRSGAASFKALFLSRDNPSSRARIERAGMLQDEFLKALGRWLKELDAPFRNPIPLFLVSSILTAFVLICLSIFGLWVGGFLAGVTLAGIVAIARSLRLFGLRAALFILVIIGGVLASIHYGF